MSKLNGRRGPSRSVFAVALRGLIDNTKVFTREEWADYLRISPAAISQWLTDRTVPRPDLLYLIYDTLETTDGVPSAPLAEFRRIADLPASSISPIGLRMGSTVWTYMTETGFRDLGRRLRGLDRAEQVRALVEGSMGPVVEGAEAREEPDADISVLPGRSYEWYIVQPDCSSLSAALLPRLVTRNETGNIAQRLDWQSLADSPSAVVIGGPGAGKSALLSHLAEYLQRDRQIHPLLVRPIAADGQPDRGEEIVTDLAESGRVDRIVLIDGLDELPLESRSSAIADVLRLSSERPETQVIATSRPIPEVETGLRSFQRYWIAPLTRLQTVLWLHKVFESAEPSRAREFERYICELAERTNLFDVAGTPLFLSSACSLFVNHGITPFSDAELVTDYLQRVLVEWNVRKRVVRARWPWASPQKMTSVLGDIAYRVLLTSSREFSTSQFAGWFRNTTHISVPPRRVLQVLSEQSGVVNCRSLDSWEVDERLVDYLAATHVVDSCEDATQVFRGWSEKKALREVVRLASSLSSDATPIFELVTSTNDATEGDRVEMLASMLAQPVRASSQVLNGVSRRIVQWLDDQLQSWQVTRPERDFISDADCFWKLSAKKIASAEDAVRTWGTVATLHQARSGPAAEYITQRLSKAEGPLLRALSESFAVNGKFEVNATSGYRSVSAQVVMPQVA